MNRQFISSRDLLEIEYTCDKYEKTGHVGPFAIRATLDGFGNQASATCLLDELLYTDLCMVHRNGGLPQKSLVADYSTSIRELQDFSLLRRALMAEFQFRSELGGSLTVEKFQSWCPAESGVSCFDLYNIINARQPLELRIGKTRVPLNRPVVMGRRTKSEPNSVTVVAGTQETRIVVSDSRFVSRRQVSISRPFIDKIEVSNLGSKLPVFVDGDKEVRPKKKYVAASISKVEFHGVSVKIARLDNRDRTARGWSTLGN